MGVITSNPGDLAAFLLAQFDIDAVRATMREWHTSRCSGTEPDSDYTYPCQCGVPERMMADVEAKRAVIARHVGDQPTLLALAQPYVGASGWQEAWVA